MIYPYIPYYYREQVSHHWLGTHQVAGLWFHWVSTFDPCNCAPSSPDWKTEQVWRTGTGYLAIRAQKRSWLTTSLDRFPYAYHKPQLIKNHNFQILTNQPEVLRLNWTTESESSTVAQHPTLWSSNMFSWKTTHQLSNYLLVWNVGNGGCWDHCQ